MAACTRPDPAPTDRRSTAPSLLIVTIDTLRADRVGIYGDGEARTPAIDALAGRGVTFAQAFAPTPITLPSHASLMTGRYPAGHGARHNGMRLDLSVPTLADHLSTSGVATAAVVAAFPLDRRFGLIKGFETYGDRLPRAASGRPANERPGSTVVDALRPGDRLRPRRPTAGRREARRGAPSAPSAERPAAPGSPAAPTGSPVGVSGAVVRTFR
jgi:hypothetical protein